MNDLKKKLQDYDIRIVLRDNWKDIKKIVKWSVTAVLVYLLGRDFPIFGVLASVIIKVILDFLDYLLDKK